MADAPSARAPRFSAVIPAYNREATVERAVESALAQTHPADEILVVDDGSVDATAERVARFGDRVRYVFQENAGASAARNHGVRLARSEWIAFLDSDDFWRPEHLDRLGEAMRSTGGRADVYFSDMQRSPEEGSVLLWEACGFAPARPWELREDARGWALMPRQPLMLQSAVVRRQRYLEVGGLHEGLRSRHDTHLFFLLCIGRPACAVAGCGTEMTSDDASGNRVTSAYGSRTRAYWNETVVLYDDVAGRFRDTLRPQERRELAKRRAGGELRLARLDWTAGRRLGAATHLARALGAHPRRVVDGGARLLGRRRVAQQPAE